MEAVREVTVWTGVDYPAPNHDYLLDGDRIVAYRPWGTGEIRVLSGKIKIDRRGRKFEKLTPNPFKEVGKKETSLIQVKGSKGNVYYVDPEARTCTCSGFQFRGQCRHLAENC
jgi:dipeptidyl aminopeptidase/acylaminoacyl peptidase